jgi:general stress protein YciG
VPAYGSPDTQARPTEILRSVKLRAAISDRFTADVRTEVGYKLPNYLARLSMSTQVQESPIESAHPSGKSRRGFAAMSPERQRQIASMGGRTAHASGHAHKYTSEEARAAGRKGGAAVSQDREYMARIGRRGGHRKSTPPPASQQAR